MKARVIRGALNSKGFHEDKKRDHCYFFFHYNGKRTAVFTKISHAETEIRPPMLSIMARQLKINNSEFSELIDCSLKAEEYLALLISRNIISAQLPPSD